MHRFFQLTQAIFLPWLFAAALAKGQPTNTIGAVEPASAAIPHLTLVEAQQTAFKRNWDLLASRSGIDAASAQLIVAKEYPNPTFSWYTAKIDPRGNETPLGNSFWNRSYDTIISVNQLIEIAGKRGSRQSSARQGIVGARARFFDARRSLEQGVTKAYVAALLAAENAQVLKESAASLHHEAEIAQARFKAGDISESDEKQIENNADSFDLQAKSAEASALQSRVAVEVLMGVPQPMGLWEAEDSLEKLTFASPPEMQPTAEAARPDVLAAEADVKKSEADLRLQRALRIPDPTISLQYEHNPPGPPGPDTIGFAVSFPLPLWNLNRGNIKVAEAALDQSTFALAKARAQAVADIANSESAYHEAYERWQRYQNQIRPRATQVRQSVAYSYEKGAASLVDLLTAERDDNTTRLATAQAKSDAASAAADLKAARTVLRETELKSIP